MESLGEILRHPDDFYALLKLKMEVKHLEKQVPPERHWRFCYNMLQKVSRSFALLIQQLGTDLRNAVCVCYLVLRALDTVGGTNEYKVLMDEFHNVLTALLELDRSYQEIIEEITMRMGGGMAKFVCKEVETIEDCDEYCHYVAGLVGLGLSKLFHASGLEDLAPEYLSNSMGLFLQKVNVIQDYLEDIDEKAHLAWPRQIWSKYVNKLEDLKYEENSVKAVQCLNEMLTYALIHAEVCLKYMSSLRDPAILRFCAVPQIMAIGTYTLCYNNIEVFRGDVKISRGLTAKIIDRTRTMEDVYGAFLDFSYIWKSKINKSDPNATRTLSRIEAIQKACIDSGTLNKRKSYIIRSRKRQNSVTCSLLFIILALLFAYFTVNRPNDMCEDKSFGLAA